MAPRDVGTMMCWSGAARFGPFGVIFPMGFGFWSPAAVASRTASTASPASPRPPSTRRLYPRTIRPFRTYDLT